MNQIPQLIKLYNPLQSDFSIQMDYNNDQHPITFTIHAGEIESFDKPIAEHMRDHLAKRIAQEIRGKGTWEDAYQKALEQIKVS